MFSYSEHVPDKIFKSCLLYLRKRKVTKSVVNNCLQKLHLYCTFTQSDRKIVHRFIKKYKDKKDLLVRIIRWNMDNLILKTQLKRPTLEEVLKMMGEVEIKRKKDLLKSVHSFTDWQGRNLATAGISLQDKKVIWLPPVVSFPL